MSIFLKPLYILEGVDGVGKTTLSKMLAEKVEGTYFREPGSTPFGEKLRDLLDDRFVLSDITKLYLFAAAREELGKKVQQERYKKPVVLDRSLVSSWVYQQAVKNEVLLPVLSHFFPLHDVSLFILYGDYDTVKERNGATFMEQEEFETLQRRYIDFEANYLADRFTSVNYIDIAGTPEEILKELYGLAEYSLRLPF